jgi:hypothetical protein
VQGQRRNSLLPSELPVSAKPERCAGGGQAGAALVVAGEGSFDGSPEGGGMARLGCLLSPLMALTVAPDGDKP